MIQESFDALREKMVRDQLESRGIRDARVLAALRKVPRHQFVPEDCVHLAYEDRPVSIGLDQTISQPYMVACMTEWLEVRGGEKVLEVGTGSGYQTAILAELGAEVVTIERLAHLSHRARQTLAALGFGGIRFVVGDGSAGGPEGETFDRIIVTAGAPSSPVGLVRALGERGRLVIPVGDEARQDLMLYVREEGTVSKKKLCACSFVKLVGKEGW